MQAEATATHTLPQLPFFEVKLEPATRTAWVHLNRPEVKNAMNGDFWNGLPKLVAALEAQPEVRVVIFIGKGGHFSAGLDLKDFYMQQRETIHGPLADDRERLLQMVHAMQRGMRAVADSSKVYISAVQGYCIGAGLDLISACDLRLADASAIFSLREARVGIVADMGSLNRLPSIIGDGNTRLLALTGRDINAAEASRMGLVSAVYPTGEELIAAATALAAEIAANPAIAVRGTKHILNYMQSHGPDEGMDYVALYNAAFLDSKDFREVVLAFLEKRKPNFK